VTKVEDGAESYLCVVCCLKFHKSFSTYLYSIVGTAWNMPIQHIETGGIDAKILNDQNSQTCSWFQGGNELKLKLESTSRITSVTLISPVPYKGANTLPINERTKITD
jgi:hypothetical protein